MRLRQSLIAVFLFSPAVALTSRTAEAATKNWQLGVDVGSEATYGNSVTMGYRLFKYDQLHWGLGYNSTGAKVGVGNDLVVPIFDSFAFKAGMALVYSGGTSGEVEVDSKFKPEGSSSEEDMTAVKQYELGSAVLLGFGAGAHWDYFSFLRFLVRVCYNLPVAGNEVTLGKKITYDRDVEVTNEDEFSDDFDKEAKKIVRAGGFGFSMGAAFVF